jgi:hypothetical protein
MVLLGYYKSSSMSIKSLLFFFLVLRFFILLFGDDYKAEVIAPYANVKLDETWYLPSV